MPSNLMYNMYFCSFSFVKYMPKPCLYQLIGVPILAMPTVTLKKKQLCIILSIKSGQYTCKLLTFSHPQPYLVLVTNYQMLTAHFYTGFNVQGDSRLEIRVLVGCSSQPEILQTAPFGLCGRHL